MRFGSVCSGIEAASVAWEPLGWEPVWFAEIEPYPSAVLKERFPNVPNYGDFTAMLDPNHEVHSAPPIDLLVGGCPCFPGDVRVLTDAGPMPISRLKVGDMVLTHAGRYRPVLAVGSRQAPTVRVRGQGASIVTTHEHPFLSRSRTKKWDGANRTHVRRFGDEEWTEAKDMQDRYWASLRTYPSLPIPEISVEGRETPLDVEFNAAFFWFVGTWLGNGWTRVTARRGSVYVADAHESADELERRITDAGLHAGRAAMRTATRFVVSSRPLARWLDANFGKAAANKTLPAWVLGLPDELRQAFLDGYVFADGTRTKTPAGWKVATTSRDLALGTKCLFWSFGRSVTEYVAHPKREECVIEGRKVNERPHYQVGSSDIARSSFEMGDKRWGLVREVKDTGNVETVYNIEVADDNTYTAEGIVVHNCQDFSVAGLRAGIEGARGHLTLAFLQLARILRPRWLVYENVPGLLTSDGGRAFGAFLGGLEELGYGWSYRTLDAQYVRVEHYARAVPQRRRRVFVVGHSGADWLRPASVLLEPEGSDRDSVPRRTTWEEAAAALGRSPAGSSMSGAERSRAEHLPLQNEGSRGAGSGGSGGDGVVPIDLRQAARGEKDTNDRTTGGAPGTGVGEPGDPAYTVSARQQGVAVLNAEARSDGSHWDDMRNPHPTLTQVSVSSGGIGCSNQEVFGQRGGGIVPVVAPTLTAANNPSRSPQSSEVTAQVEAVLNAEAYRAQCWDGTDTAQTLTTNRCAGQANYSAVLQPICARESGQGFWMEDTVAGTLRAEGENRPSRPSHIVGLVSPVAGTLDANYGKGPGERGGIEREVIVTFAAPAIGAFVPCDVAGTLMKHTGAGAGETQNAAYVLGPDPRVALSVRPDEVLFIAEDEQDVASLLAEMFAPPVEEPDTVAFTAEDDEEVAIMVAALFASEHKLSASGGSYITNRVAFGFDTYNHAVSDVSQTLKSPSGGVNESIGTVLVPKTSEAASARNVSDRGQVVSEVSPSLCARDFKVSKPEAGGQPVVVEPVSAFYSFASAPPMAFAQNQLGEVRAGEVFNTLNTNSNASGRNTAMVAYPVDSSVSYAAPAIGTLVSSDVAGTLMKNNGAGSGETQNAAYIQSHMAVRRLTPVECERLMGFSDGHTRIPWRKKPASECPDGPRYKALGNSMAVNCMRFIGERIALIEDTFAELDAAAQVEAEVP